MLVVNILIFILMSMADKLWHFVFPYTGLYNVDQGIINVK